MQQSIDTTAADTLSPSASKKAYHSPQFKAHGPISEITETSGTLVPGGDGGTLPNLYAS